MAGGAAAAATGPAASLVKPGDEPPALIIWTWETGGTCASRDPHGWVVSEHRHLDPTAGGRPASQMACPPPPPKLIGLGCLLRTSQGQAAVRHVGSEQGSTGALSPGSAQLHVNG